ncbi:MAG TPA: hypothetical protein P5526_10075 [Anaerolineae bacterium]|nr:hypothetical protein [Anaerolineae bacterium]MCB0177887.1 hypothetical protein [Anaerolineae bacterium]MCB9105790.1 hypothetical protein [Anaerolineales bacterium]HRV92496.1 hypothetical protein [Anaerolineae bacterium]
MAGYIFSLDSLESLHLYTLNGVYATKLSPPTRGWQTHHEGTFADYSTMQAGDNIYFFIKRKIYGIGKLVSLQSDCKFFNFPGAGQPQQFDYTQIKSTLLWDEDQFSVDQRCICIFEPDPYFFRDGIDMDDVLASNPFAFKMLRAFWKLSFIKFDDEENQAFRDIILKRNQSILSADVQDSGIFPFHPSHRQIAERVSPEYELNRGIASVLSSCASDAGLKHEMAVEAGILHQLSIKHCPTVEIFGDWDYLSHQVIASPFKPIDYMDKMDLFGYAYLANFKPTKSRFLVGEIKRDAAKVEDVDQLLKYVDWVKDEYCFGDYAMINAFLIAHEFGEDIVQHKQAVGNRKYTIGVRPARSLEWNNMKLVKYSFDAITNQLGFCVVG